MASQDDSDSCSWKLDYHMPSIVLATFHHRWPKARLHIEQYSKFRPKLDVDLFSSPQLYSLCTTVMYGQELMGHETKNEYPLLTKIIAQNENLRILRLLDGGNAYCWSPHDEYTLGPRHLNLSQVGTLPPLEVLELQGTKYQFSEPHLRQWLSCMDWTKLRELDLGKLSPGPLLRALTGEIPQLKVFKFGQFPELFSVTPSDWKSDVETIDAFIQSIEGLEELSWRNHRGEQIWKAVWPSLLRKHGSSLRKLYVTWEMTHRFEWELNELEDLLIHAPYLVDLTTQLKLNETRALNCVRLLWVGDIIQIANPYAILRVCSLLTRF